MCVSYQVVKIIYYTQFLLLLNLFVCLFHGKKNQTNPESLLKESMNSLDRAASSPLLARITMRSQKVGSWQRFAAKLSEPSFRQKAVQQDPSSKCLIKKMQRLGSSVVVNTHENTEDHTHQLTMIKRFKH